MGVLNCSHVTLATQLDQVDTVITDPPFSPRVHRGATVRRRRDGSTGMTLDGLKYDAWTPDDARRLVEVWSPRCRRWFVVLCSHDQIGTYEEALRAAGRKVFAPVPCVIVGMTVRMCGDGPSSWAVYAVCARPRAMRPLSGTLRGAHVGKRERLHMSGGKPVWLMDELVQDYSRPGDVVCDPCAGSGTTLVAGLRAGRGVVGAEAHPGRAALANQRLADVLMQPAPPPPPPRQTRKPCPYCGRSRVCTEAARAENPYCARCLHARMDAAASQQPPDDVSAVSGGCQV